MTNDTQDARKKPAADDAAQQRPAPPQDTQPPPTGAQRGSPAAPVMKEFQKTRNESSGRS